MHRAPLLVELEKFAPFDDKEKADLQAMQSFIASTPDCFKREHLAGHITASALILNPSYDRLLLLHHKKLDKWIQPGGHCDGDPDTRAVAEREAAEELGIKDLFLAHENIFALDIHTIPPWKEVPEHLHYDVRYLYIADEAEHFAINHEAVAADWWSLKDLPRIAPDLARAGRKIAAFKKP
ncbi:MAG: NUDIX domain-containing protein [Dongiaceae bacterium]